MIPACVRMLRRLRSEERGQSLILVTIAMAIGLGFCAVGIDTASWYQKHHEMQVVADSAALAAANCLANPGVGPSGYACSSSTDTTTADAVAVHYAALNNVTITDSQISINTSKDTVEVSPSNTSPSFFAQVFGIKTTTQAASSTAGWSSGGSTATPCSEASSKTLCSAIYSADSSCSSGAGVTSGSSSDGFTLNVSGNIHSEGLMTLANNGSLQSDSGGAAPSLTVAGSCYTALTLPSKSGYTATQVASEGWPINYAESPYFTACSTAAGTCTTSAATNGVAGSPSYCTLATTSSSGYTFTDFNGVDQLPVSGNVYCAIGTGTVSNPATWNGTIQVESTDCSSPYKKVTFIGGNVSFENGAYGGTEICYQPALYNCLVYSTGTVADTNSTLNWSGDIFAPDGAIDFGSTGSGIDATSTGGMLEGLDVDLQNGTLNLIADGNVPSSSSGTSSSSSSGTDYLTQ